jgi:hypothetical protein
MAILASAGRAKKKTSSRQMLQEEVSESQNEIIFVLNESQHLGVNKPEERAGNTPHHTGQADLALVALPYLPRLRTWFETCEN